MMTEGFDNKMVQLARYLLDSTLLSYSLLKFSPFALATATAYITRLTIVGDGWCPNLILSEEDILPVARAVLEEKSKLTELTNLRKKYSSEVTDLVLPCDL